MPLSVLTRVEARRLLLGQQGLISRFRNPEEAVQAMVAVQTQYAASLPVAVAARVRAAKPGWDDAALDVGGGLIKTWSLRFTLHVHRPEDHALILGTLGPRRYQRFLSNSVPNMAELEERMLEFLAACPLSREELHERVPELRQVPYTGWGRDVAGLAFRRRLCIVGRGSQQRFALLAPSEATCDWGSLFVRYVEAFGPVTRADFAHWAGVFQSEARFAVEAGTDRLEEVRVEGSTEPHYVRKDFCVPKGRLGVRLLAKFDPMVLALKDKSVWLRTEHKSSVFRAAGQVEAVVLSQGIAVATWRLERSPKETLFRVEPFDSLTSNEMAEIEEEANRMVRLLGYPTATMETV